MSEIPDLDPNMLAQLSGATDLLKDEFRTLDIINEARGNGQLVLHNLQVNDVVTVFIHGRMAQDEWERTITGRMIDQETATFSVEEDTGKYSTLLGRSINFGCSADLIMGVASGYQSRYRSIIVPETQVMLDPTGKEFKDSQFFVTAVYTKVILNGKNVFTVIG